MGMVLFPEHCTFKFRYPIFTLHMALVFCTHFISNIFIQIFPNIPQVKNV